MLALPRAPTPPAEVNTEFGDVDSDTMRSGSQVVSVRQYASTPPLSIAASRSRALCSSVDGRWKAKRGKGVPVRPRVGCLKPQERACVRVALAHLGWGGLEKSRLSVFTRQHATSLARPRCYASLVALPDMPTTCSSPRVQEGEGEEENKKKGKARGTCGLQLSSSCSASGLFSPVSLRTERILSLRERLRAIRGLSVSNQAKVLIQKVKVLGQRQRCTVVICTACVHFSPQALLARSSYSSAPSPRPGICVAVI